MSDLEYQSLSPVQSKQQPTPMRYAATAAGSTVAPTTALTVITSDNAAAKTITIITPPVTGYHELSFMGTAAAPTPFATGGNVGVAYTVVQNRPIRFYYDPVLTLYYPMAVS